MNERPLSVAVGIVIESAKILLITRTDGTYAGMWSLPGGKIEVGEHVGEAAVREILEETGIQSTFVRHLGVVSEHLTEHGAVQRQFILHICELAPTTTNIIQQENEGTPQWYPLQQLPREQMIPSDYKMIEHFVQQKGKGYVECIIEKVGEKHELRLFE